MKELLKELIRLGAKIRTTEFGYAVPGTSVALTGVTVATLEPLCPQGWEITEAKNLLACQSQRAIYVTPLATLDELLEHGKNVSK